MHPNPPVWCWSDGHQVHVPWWWDGLCRLGVQLELGWVWSWYWQVQRQRWWWLNWLSEVRRERQRWGLSRGWLTGMNHGSHEWIHRLWWDKWHWVRWVSEILEDKDRGGKVHTEYRGSEGWQWGHPWGPWGRWAVHTRPLWPGCTAGEHCLHWWVHQWQQQWTGLGRQDGEERHITQVRKYFLNPSLIQSQKYLAILVLPQKVCKVSQLTELGMNEQCFVLFPAISKEIRVVITFYGSSLAEMLQDVNLFVQMQSTGVRINHGH